MKLNEFTARCLRLLRDQGGPSKARHLLPMGYSEDQSISIRQAWSHCCAVGWAQQVKAEAAHG